MEDINESSCCSVKSLDLLNISNSRFLNIWILPISGKPFCWKIKKAPYESVVNAVSRLSIPTFKNLTYKGNVSTNRRNCDGEGETLRDLGTRLVFYCCSFNEKQLRSAKPSAGMEILTSLNTVADLFEHLINIKNQQTTNFQTIDQNRLPFFPTQNFSPTWQFSLTTIHPWVVCTGFSTARVSWTCWRAGEWGRLPLRSERGCPRRGRSGTRDAVSPSRGRRWTPWACPVSQYACNRGRGTCGGSCQSQSGAGPMCSCRDGGAGGRTWGHRRSGSWCFLKSTITNVPKKV